MVLMEQGPMGKVGPSPGRLENYPLCPGAICCPAANSISQGVPGSHYLPASQIKSDPLSYGGSTCTMRSSILPQSWQVEDLGVEIPH